MCDDFPNKLKIMMSVRPSKNLSGKALILTRHCLMSGRYFEPCNNDFRTKNLPLEDPVVWS